jgi:CubicO group peptidase (beta-lactamase class C family)
LDFTESRLLKKIEALPIENAPGAEWNYRNTNYVLLGILIHRVTGMFYADYLGQHIFKPLGMSSTRLISDADIIPNRAAGYQLKDGALKNQDWVSPTFNSTADGALYFNVLDLAKWDAALYTTRLLRQSSLNAMWTISKLNNGKPNSAHYGFGWRINAQNGHRVLEHSGAWQGFTCNISRYPQDSLTVTVLTNLDADHARPEYMAQVIAGKIDAALLPQKLSRIADNRPGIAASLASLLGRIANGRVRDAGAETRRLIAPLWPGGTLTLVDRVPSPETGSLMLSQFRLAKAGRSLLVTYGLSARGKIDVLFVEPDKEYRSREI